MDSANNDMEDYDDSENEDEVVDAQNDEEFIAPVQYDITSYGADYDVEGLVKRLTRNDILIPSFQRNYVWSQREASSFVESLLLGLPVPGVFFVKERESNKLLVIDGQQRLKSLQFFYGGYFNPKNDEKKQQVFKLIDVQKKFADRTYATLDEEDKVKLNDSLIHATIIKQELPSESDDTSIYHIFDRLNSRGRRLTPQEIRTAIYHGRFIDLIKRLNDYSNWRKIYGKPSPRLKDQEMVLRFLALFFLRSKYKRPFNEFLNDFCLKYRNPDDNFLEQSEKIFTSTVDVMWNSVGKLAFKPITTINAAVFDSVMVGLAQRITSTDKAVDNEAVRNAYFQLVNDNQYLTLVSQSTSDDENVKTRVQKAIEAFAD
jgi:hypothetical protein